MENSNNKIIGILNHLIAIVEDGKEGYKSAAENVKENAMQTMFEKYVNQRIGFIAQLQHEVTNLGGTPENSGGPIGALHRTWIDMKAALTAGDRDAVINACVTGEEAAIKNYKDAITTEAISGQLKMVIEAQLSGIQEAIHEIKSKVAVKA